MKNQIKKMLKDASPAVQEKFSCSVETYYRATGVVEYCARVVFLHGSIGSFVKTEREALDYIAKKLNEAETLVGGAK